jgi:hypothetical protein
MIYKKIIFINNYLMRKLQNISVINNFATSFILLEHVHINDVFKLLLT